MRRILIAGMTLLLAAGTLNGQDRFGDVDRTLLLKRERPSSADARRILMAPEPTPLQTLFDVIHYDVDIAFDDDDGSVEGRITATVESLTDSLPEIDFDADAVLTILSVEIEGYGPASWIRETDLLKILPPVAVAAGERITFTVYYEGNPTMAMDNGLFLRWYYTTPIIYSLSQPWSARTWWPCKDYPDDKATFDIALSVRPEFTAASNGEYIGQSDTTHWGETFTKYRWRENHPMSPYLFSIASTNYVVLTDQFEYAPGQYMQITNYVYPSLVAKATTDLSISAPVLEFFSSLFGMYPFVDEKYGVALCAINGGMEHQTLCSYGSFLITGDHRYDWLWIHELGHQWFGDKVTCSDWTHIWLNEGWASYTEALWYEHLGGFEDLRDYMAGMDNPGSWDGPVLRDPDNDDPWYYFDLVVYDKGAWVVHMLRHIMGDQAFFDATRAYLADPLFSYGSVDTEQFESFFEGFYGGPLDWFFDPWLTRTDRLVYEWSWNTWQEDGRDLLSIFVRQDVAQPYAMPVDFRITRSASVIDTVLWVNDLEESFLLELPFSPTSISLDPDGWILCDNYTVATDSEQLPPAFFLSQNTPNPFNPSTTISFGLDEPSDAGLRIYDVRGALVETLVDRRLDAGAYEMTWNGTDSKGRPASSGVYFYRLTAGGRELTRKMILLR